MEQQFIVYAAGLLLALLAFAHPRRTAAYLDQFAGRLHALAPLRRYGASPRAFTDAYVRAGALVFALLFTMILCALGYQ